MTNTITNTTDVLATRRERRNFVNFTVVTVDMGNGSTLDVWMEDAPPCPFPVSKKSNGRMFSSPDSPRRRYWQAYRLARIVDGGYVHADMSPKGTTEQLQRLVSKFDACRNGSKSLQMREYSRDPLGGNWITPKYTALAQTKSAKGGE